MKQNNLCSNMKQLAIAALAGLENRIAACKAAQYKPNDMSDLGWSETRQRAYWNMELFKAVYQYEKIAERFGLAK